MAEKSTEKKNFLSKFFKSLKAEMKVIHWPTRNDVIKNTAVVVVISAILCGFIRLIDVLTQYLVTLMNTIVK